MTSYAVTHRSSDDMWTVRSGGRTGTVVRKYKTREKAAKKGRDLAKPGDSLTVYNMDGSVSRNYDSPRR
jgi:hypothetical protein